MFTCILGTLGTCRRCKYAAGLNVWTMITCILYTLDSLRRCLYIYSRCQLKGWALATCILGTLGTCYFCKSAAGFNIGFYDHLYSSHFRFSPPLVIHLQPLPVKRLGYIITCILHTIDYLRRCLYIYSRCQFKGWIYVYLYPWHSRNLPPL